MQIKDLIEEVNGYTEQLDFATAKKLIEENKTLINKHRKMLNKYSKELLKTLSDNQKISQKPISPKDKVALMDINNCALNFNIISLKMIVENQPFLLLKKDSIKYLNNNAKVILVGMGVFNKNEIFSMKNYK